MKPQMTQELEARRDGRWAFVERSFTMHFATPLKNWAPVAGTERFGLPA